MDRRYEHINDLAAIAEGMQFPYCDLKHENVLRTEDGELMARNNILPVFVRECPAGAQVNMPACAHCRDQAHPEHDVTNDVLLLLSTLLQSVDPSNAELQSLQVQYEENVSALHELDRAMRVARTGTEYNRIDPKTLPSLNIANKNGQPLILQHRAIVNSMRNFRDTLLEIVQTKSRP